MKLKHFILMFLLCWFAGSQQSQAADITVDQALAKVKTLVKNANAKYYLVSTKDDTIWKIFVDLEPSMGWEHPCCVYDIPKDEKSASKIFIPQLLKLPPEEPLTLLGEKQGVAITLPRPNVKVMNNSINPEVANRTYVVILSGGWNKNANYERYWNDCAFVYQALKRNYGVPQENFRILMADGTNPEADMRTMGGTYVSSPLDLDADGVNDIGYAATKQNISTVLSQLASVMGRDDHLLFYVIDHGGSVDYVSKSYICLWNETMIYDYELAAYLKPLLNNNVSVNVVLGQCYSGGFVDDLSSIGCVVAAASSGSESSWACSNGYYDEFVYHWTCAINGGDTSSAVINADYNRDGKVSMQEAFQYAQSHDKRSETPEFYCGPDDYGKYLAFSYLPKSDDLYIKDNWLDVGDEPNRTTDIFWNSPSIWVRNNEDGGTQHENPYYNNTHEKAYIYSVIQNKGEKRYYKGKWLQLYWANASVGLRKKTWRGRESMNDFQSGGPLESMMIKHKEKDDIPLVPILPNDSIIMVKKWPLPESMSEMEEGNYHCCIYAKIMDGPTDEPFEGGSRMLPMLSSKEAQKNVIIVRIEDEPGPIKVYVRNIVSTMAPYSLEIFTRSASDKQLFSIANVELGMSKTIYDAWVRGGKKGEAISNVSSGQNAPTEFANKVRLLSANSKLQAVQMNPEEFDLVSMSFDFIQFPLKETSYYVDLIQRDENGEIIGGETFLVIAPAASKKSLPIEKTSTEDGSTMLVVDNEDFSSVCWFDENGEKLGNTHSLVLNPALHKQEITVTGFTRDGENAETTISVDPKIGFKSIYSQGDVVRMEFLDAIPQDASINLLHVEDANNNLTIDIPEGATEFSVDASDLKSGVYVSTLVISNEIVDSSKVIITN